MTNKEMEDLLFSSIDEVRSGYEAREVSPVEVLEATLTRLEELEPRLNAFVSPYSLRPRESRPKKRRRASCGTSRRENSPVSPSP
jgi:Asp-tRNA(Asn)/Glu-tRNA(Gln) amidotransferase A subunit family amidase